MADDDDDRPALRAALLLIEELRDDVHQLAAQVVALTEAHAASASPSDPRAAERAVDDRARALAPDIAAAAASSNARVLLGEPLDKYDLPAPADGGPPCLELMPLCQARCCALAFPLTSQDLDEGVLRWDHGQPYVIRQGADRRCVHQDRDSYQCGCYAQRPATCRLFDCRADPRIWLDYAARVPAPMSALDEHAAPAPAALRATAAGRSRALLAESHALRQRR
ncbi:MAG: YkgJ family cysteine cluster protein [Kofleriaceae bacterium]